MRKEWPDSDAQRAPTHPHKRLEPLRPTALERRLRRRLPQQRLQRAGGDALPQRVDHPVARPHQQAAQ
eukprot:scaffold2090_cov225-Prasinococcus_capsulatus_cf.AAC.36